MSSNLNTNQYSKVIGIQFSICSPEEIRKGSVVEITSKDTYVNNKPAIGGLFDPRMGVLEAGLICPTDGLDYMQTPGYGGHIELARPVFYIQFLNHIMKWLNCVCFECSQLLISKKKYKQVLKLKGEARWKCAYGLCQKVKRCGDDNENGCGNLQPTKYKKEGFATLVAEWKYKNFPETKIICTPELILKKFKRISDDDVTFMGYSPVFSRPEWMICQVMYVPPPAARPSVKHDTQQRSEDDLTHILMSIIKTNKTLQEKIQNNSSPDVIQNCTNVLQYYVATIVDNNIPGVDSVAQRSGRPLKSIKERLNGKGGRMRGNLMAKRVDFSARSVITADPNISIRELGVPMKIAKNITKPVVVNKMNRAFLTQLVQNGPDVWPGAKMLEKPSGDMITLRYFTDRNSIVLQEGDIVHRHMMNGDAILFNRQPTLHRMSMMCHIVRVMKQGDTFRMNVADTKPYNADFDGDEMNLHMPQDPESEAELKNLAAVPYQLISPANNSSIIGIYQDSMLGCYQFTRPHIRFSPREAMNLLMMFNGINEQKLLEDLAKTHNHVSSFQLLSQIMPPLSMKYKTKAFKEGENMKDSNHVIEIHNGEYIRGQMDKSVMGAKTKGLLQRVCNDFGYMASAHFIDNLQNIITEYMKHTAFSVGISDLISNQKTNDEIVQVITKKKNDVKTLIEQVQIGLFENNTGKSNEQEFETQVNSILNNATSEAGKIGLKSLEKNNRFVIMVNAGSKGSDLNISQMISCLGQQNVDGKRIPYGFDNRTLPHFTKFDDSPGARGFVESSYINGLTPQELFFHAMGGRVGLIDTAVKTSTTGYIQRRLIKGLEDLMVSYDMTVRTNKKKIVQFEYGYDNIDTTKVEEQSIPIVSMSTQDIYAHFLLPQEKADAKLLSQVFVKNVLTRQKKQMPAFIGKMQPYLDFMMTAKDRIVKNIFKNKGDTTVSCPVSFQNIIQNIQGQCNITNMSFVDLTCLEALEMMEESYALLQKNHYAPPTELFYTLYYYYLSPKDLLLVKRFNKSALTLLLETIVLNYKKAIVAPGEMVGMIAGQSIGEVSTQMTLNSVTYETEIVVRNKAGHVQKVQIGEFIEEKIKIARTQKYYQDKDTTYAEVDEYYEIPSCDEDGNIWWKRIEAVTRHPVINEDGTNTMLKVTTEEEREIIATKAKSFLKLVNGKILPLNGDQLKVGDYLPVSKMPIDFCETHELSLRDLLPPTEYIYSAEVEKAKEVMGEHHWWTKHQGKTFTLPYKRSDTFVAKVGEKLRNGCVSKTAFAPHCVYMLQTNMNDYTIPECILLDYNFGYLLGAYAAEGCMTKFQISIANNVGEYFAPILELCKKWNITTKIYKQENKGKEGWTSQDLRIYNTVLCRILEKTCGKLSHNKFVLDKIVYSNKECILGFLDAYIGGDGYVCKQHKYISMSSVSKNLLLDVQQMLNILDVYSSIQKPKKVEKNSLGTLSENIRQIYYLSVRNGQAKKLASMLHLTLQYKQDNLQAILQHTPLYEINKKATIIPDEVDGNLLLRKRQPDTYSGVLFDKIKSIEEVPNTTKYAYDLTVADTRNFNLQNGICTRDTFHFAGVASKSNVTRGVPRIEEILSLSNEIKNPSLSVYLKPEYETEKEHAQSIMYMLEHTKLHDVVKTIEICFDPDDLNTLMKEDKDTIEQFKVFEKMVEECGGETIATDDDNEQSKWIVRIEIDPDVLLEKNITMDDIHFAIKESYPGDVQCVYSDLNADKLIFRVRMKNALNMKGVRKNRVKSLDQTDDIYMLKNFQNQLLQHIILRGVKGIHKVILRKIVDNVVNKNGLYVKQDIWVLDTIGTNLLDVLALDFIDQNRTISNNIMEIYDVLGIEAARQTIYNELMEVVEFDGTYINYHNYSVLIDRMSFTHKLISIYRHGINNDDIGAIAKASFEETPEMFLKAARHAELDNMRGISANVMCGQEGTFGTSAFQVLLDMESMQKLQEVSKYKRIDVEEEIEKFFGGGVAASQDACSLNNIVIQNNVATIQTEEVAQDNAYNPGF